MFLKEIVKMLLGCVLSIPLVIMVSESRSVGSDSNSLLTCSKFHFEENVLEKLVRLEHKMEIHKEKMERWEVKLESLYSKIDEQIKMWENTFSTKLYKMDEAVNETEIFVKSVRDIQLQEQSRINDSLQEIVEKIEIRAKNETELIGEHMNNMLELMSSKIEEVSVADKKRHDAMDLMQYTLLKEQKQFNQSFDLLLKNTKLRSHKTINELFSKQQKVAVTACVSSSQTFPDYVVRFSTVNFKEGIDNLDTFKFSGKFVCEIPGLYYISAHIYTNTQGYGFNVKKNGMNIATSASGSGSTDTTNPISAVVELQSNDTLYVYAGHYIHSSQSCMSIMKIN